MLPSLSLELSQKQNKEMGQDGKRYTPLGSPRLAVVGFITVSLWVLQGGPKMSLWLEGIN